MTDTLTRKAASPLGTARVIGMRTLESYLYTGTDVEWHEELGEDETLGDEQNEVEDDE